MAPFFRGQTALDAQYAIVERTHERYTVSNVLPQLCAGGP